MCPTVSPVPAQVPTQAQGNSKDAAWPTKNNPFMHKDYVEDDPDTRNKKLKSLSKNNRYIQYYQTLSDKYFPKLMGILDDIYKCTSDRARNESNNISNPWSSISEVTVNR